MSEAEATTIRSGKGFRFNLLTILLLVAVIACWLSFYRTRTETQRMQSQLPALRELSRALIVDNPSQYAIVRHHQLWNDDFRWKVYLPPHRTYRLSLATEQVDGAGFPAADQTIGLDSGTHELQLRIEKGDDQCRVEVLVNGQVKLTSVKSVEWMGSGGSVGGSSVSSSTEQKLDSPLEIFRRQFMRGEGVALWIEANETSELERSISDD